jgi:hypothetical protein
VDAWGLQKCLVLETSSADDYRIKFRSRHGFVSRFAMQWYRSCGGPRRYIKKRNMCACFVLTLCASQFEKRGRIPGKSGTRTYPLVLKLTSANYWKVHTRTDTHSSTFNRGTEFFCPPLRLISVWGTRNVLATGHREVFSLAGHSSTTAWPQRNFATLLHAAARYRTRASSRLLYMFMVHPRAGK